MPAIRSHRRIALAAFAALVLTLFAVATPAAASDDLWIHVHIQEEEGATVRVNLPIAFAESAARAIPDIETDSLTWDDEDISLAELRDMWRSLGDTGEALLVDIDDDGAGVTVRKTGGYLLVEVDENDPYDGRQAEIDIRIPERVVEALLSGDGDELNLSAALRALADSGEGELVAVNDDDARVRIWVDGNSHAE